MSDPDIPPPASSGSTTGWTIPGTLPLLLLLLGSLIANAVGVTWGLPNTVDWSLDSVAPHRVLHAMEQGFSNGWWDRYPPLHLALLAALYAPWLAFLRATGRLGTGVTLQELVDPLHTFGDLILIARVVSVAMGVGVVLLAYLVVRRLFDPRAAFFAGLLVALNHPFVYYAHSANVDVPYLFWFTLAIYWFVGVLERGALRDYLLFAVFATFAVCTKDQAYGLFVLSPLAVMWARGREAPAGEPASRRVARVLLDRRNLAAAGAAAGVFVLLHNLPLNLSGFLAHVRYITGHGSEAFTEFPNTPDGHARLLGATWRHLAGGMTWPLLAVCAAGAAYCALRFPRRALPVLLLAAGYAAAFLHVARYVYPRFVLPIAIILSLFGGKLLGDLWGARPGRRPGGIAASAALRTAVVAAFLPAAALVVQLDVLLVRDPRYGAERWLERHAPAGALVETLAPSPFVETWYPRFPAHVKVRSSRIGGGAQWLPATGDPPRIPNVHGGREAPDFIVLSGRWYEGVLRRDPGPGGRLLRGLFGGGMGYVEAVQFDAPLRLPVDLRIGPKVVIFQRQTRSKASPPDVAGPS